MANPTDKPQQTTHGLTPTHEESKNSYWENYPSINTPIIDQQLNRVETAVDDLDKIVLNMDNWKAEADDLLPLISNITFDKKTGTFTITRYNSTSYPIDTDIEKIAINFDYDDDPTSPHYQQLIITLDDAGPTTPATVKYVDLSALITEYEFDDTATIHFAVANTGEISASVIDGSITEAKLQNNFLADCRAAAGSAQTSATNSSNKALVSEGWAVGTQNGTAVTSESPYYHNNSKYWSDETHDYLSRLAFSSMSVVTSDWTINYDPVTSTNYPYICRKEIQETLPDNPNWRMVGSGNIPVGTEIDSISFVLEAWFGTGAKYYTSSSTYVDTTAGTILLYSTALPVDNLRLQYKGV